MAAKKSNNDIYSILTVAFALVVLGMMGEGAMAFICLGVAILMFLIVLVISVVRMGAGQGDEGAQ